MKLTIIGAILIAFSLGFVFRARITEREIQPPEHSHICIYWDSSKVIPAMKIDSAFGNRFIIDYSDFVIYYDPHDAGRTKPCRINYRKQPEKITITGDTISGLKYLMDELLYKYNRPPVVLITGDKKDTIHFYPGDTIRLINSSTQYQDAGWARFAIFQK